MITFFSKMTVAKIFLIFFPAVFFSAAIAAQDSSLINLEYGLNELVYDVSRAVVTVEASEPIYPQNYSLTDNDAVYSVISTGLIYDTSGFIIAPAESVSKYATIFIRFDDKTVPAKTVAIDYQNGIALLKMQNRSGKPIRLKSQTGCAGQMILAVGNILGVRAAPTLGICAGYRPDGMMQFSASFTPSSQGGGLFSMDGKLLGIITAQIGSSSEIGLAIPAYKIPEIVNYLKVHGDRYAGYLGLVTREIEVSPPIIIQLLDNTSRLSSAMSPPKDRVQISHGLIVEKVVKNAPSYKAGLRKGDLLFHANGLTIDNPIEFAEYIKKTNPGTIIDFDFLRNNSIYSVKIPIGKQEQFVKGAKSPHGDKSDIMVDSILKEIEVLKQNIQGLESRLKQLR